MSFGTRSLRTALPGVCMLLGVCGAGMLGAQEPSAKPPAVAEPPTQVELDREIGELIEQLGAAQYATRERAQAELRRLGLSAFDALHDAQYHKDIEVALRARYLVQSMNVTWWRETDSPEVKRILKDYGKQAEPERRNRMDQLSKLDDRDGITPLCRLVRFETSNVLSKHAALLVMNFSLPESEPERTQLASQIRDNVGISKRPAAAWLKVLAETIEHPSGQLDKWREITRGEQQTLAQFPNKSSREIARELLRWRAELLRRVERKDEAVAVIRETFGLVEGTREQLLDVVDWLMAREVWELVDEFAQRFPEPFSKDPQLLYRLAESQLKQGEQAGAERTAEQALRLNAEDPDEHILAALALQERGLRPWAQREYRLILELVEAGSLDDLRTRFLLSEMLHDELKDLEAAQILQSVVDGMDKDKQILQRVASRFNRQPGSVRSRMHFFYARHYGKSNDVEQQLKHLREGAQHDRTDADLLIAMYRAKSPDKAFREETMKLIESAVEQFRKQIEQFRQQAERAPQEELKDWANRQLATAHNQLAWLVGNTEGDFDEAIRSSHRSLELRPNAAGYLDTLGRCYYARGDFKAAVKYQSKAVELEPHSLQIQRQLEIFKKALAEQK